MAINGLPPKVKAEQAANALVEQLQQDVGHPLVPAEAQVKSIGVSHPIAASTWNVQLTVTPTPDAGASSTVAELSSWATDALKDLGFTDVPVEIALTAPESLILRAPVELPRPVWFEIRPYPHYLPAAQNLLEHLTKVLDRKSPEERQQIVEEAAFLPGSVEVYGTASSVAHTMLNEAVSDCILVPFLQAVGRRMSEADEAKMMDIIQPAPGDLPAPDWIGLYFPSMATKPNYVSLFKLLDDAIPISKRLEVFEEYQYYAPPKLKIAAGIPGPEFWAAAFGEARLEVHKLLTIASPHMDDTSRAKLVEVLSRD